MSYFVIVTFGCPNVRIPKFRTSQDKAQHDADQVRGTGTCSAARVYECDTLSLAKSADISTVRPGERIVYSA